jgi:hypothetical protein
LNLKLENGFGHPHKSRGNPANERRKKMEELNRLIDQAKSKIGDSDVAIDKVGEIKLFISPTTSQDLKPVGVCPECGHEQVFKDLRVMAAANIFGGGCHRCHSDAYDVKDIFAPQDKLRRRIEDQLRKGPGGYIYTVAKLLRVNMSA